MMKGLLGRKVGMTQVFTEDGALIPVTVVEVVPNVVLQKKTLENDGYEAVQLGIEDVKLQRATKPAIGHAKKAGSAPKKFVREIAGNELLELEVGSEVKADLFAAGDIVDVQGTSKGKGFTGAIVRNNQRMGPASHGSGHHRGIGSLATIGRNNGIINKGRIMAGQEGGYTTTNRNLEVIKVDAENNYLLLKGNVPGPKKGYVIVKTTTKRVKQTTPKTLVNRGVGQGE
jgi:large subunit ribosomal protein L3